MFGKYSLVAFLVISLGITVDADICDLCICERNVCNSSATAIFFGDHECTTDIRDIYRCDGNQKVWRKLNRTTIELDNIEWPNENGTVAVAFNHLKLTYLTKVLCASRASASPSLTHINLDHNHIASITNDPFQYCRHLKSVSMANNSVTHLVKDFVKSSYGLERLNVSHNRLAEFDGDILVNNKILNASQLLESINAANNLLFVVNGDVQMKHPRLKYLNLSGNKLTVVTSTSFVPFPNLLTLDLSTNDLINIESEAFISLQQLHTLHLSNNMLNDLSLKLPDSVEHLSIASNDLQYWPIVGTSENLKTLELQNNRLVELYYGSHGKKTIEFTSLVMMNMSNNRIENLPTTLRYPVLTLFDLSFNRFANVPQTLGSQAPNLDWLRMNGNPLEKIEFTQKTFVRKLEFSGLTTLTEFDASQFDRIESKTGCVELTVSHCPSLQNIQNSFLKANNLCSLDLSYNGLHVLNQNWVNWAALDRGIDFQGNPIACTCIESQWLLDTFLPMMYARKEQQHYLNDFRCATPQRFEHQRLIKYFGQEGKFCEDVDADRASMGFLRESWVGVSEDSTDWLSFAVIAFLLILILLLSIAIIVLCMRRRRQRLASRNNRRYSNGGFF